MENNLIRDMRMAHGLSIREFAQRIGVSPATVTSAEKSNYITQKLKANVLRQFDLDDTFFDFVEQRKRLEDYEQEGAINV